MRFLLVDDRPADRERITRTLRQRFPDAEPCEVATRQELNRVLAQDTFDLALTGCRMAWSDGLQVLRTIRARHPHVPVVMVTDPDDEDTAIEGMQAGLSDYVLMHDLERLPAVVQDSLARARAPADVRDDAGSDDAREDREAALRARVVELMQANDRLREELEVRRQVEESLRAELDAVLRTAERLREGEKRFRIAADYAYGWECWIDEEGNVIYSSPSCERICGYSPQDFACRPGLLLEITHPDDRMSLEKHLRATYGRTEEAHITFRIITRAGDERWIEHHCQPVHDGQGVYLGRRGSLFDITEWMRVQQERERQAEQAESYAEQLRATNEELIVTTEELEQHNEELVVAQEALDMERRRYQELFELAPDGYLVTDANGIIAEANVPAATLLGQSQGSLLGQCLSKFVPEDVVSFLSNRMERLARGQRAESWEMPIKRPEGGTLPVEVNAVSGLGGVGQEPELRWLLRDVTERRAAEADRERLLQENRQQRALLEQLVESAPIGIAVVSGPEAQYRLVNPACEAILGVSGTEMAGRSLAEVFPNSVAESALELIREVYRTGRTAHEREARLDLGHEGHDTYWDIDLVPLMAPDGGVQEILILVRSVTEEVMTRRRLERMAFQVNAERARLQAILESVPEGILVTDQHGRIQYTNAVTDDLFAHVLSYNEELSSLDQLGLCKSDGTAYEPSDLPLTRALMDGEMYQDLEMAIQWPDGQWRDLLVDTAPVADETGGILGAIAMFQDITEIKSVEREREQLLDRAAAEQARAEAFAYRVEEERRRLQTILDTLPVGVSIADADGRIAETNRIMPRIWQGASASPKTPLVLDFRVFRARRATTNQPLSSEEWPLSRALAMGEPVLGEALDIVRLDGSQASVLVSAAPLFGEGKKVTGAIVVAQDITERRRLEAQLYQRTVELEERNRELDAFAHNVAHDLKNPLMFIRHAETLEQEFTSMTEEDLRTSLHLIAVNGVWMSSIINEMLLLAELRAKEVQYEPLDLGALVADVQKMLSFVQEDLGAEVTTPEAWPIALGYEPWVEQVWVNYLTNAMKYGGPKPKIEVGADLLRSGMVRCWVRDHGPGLTPEEQAKLFAPFEQIPRLRPQGHGLGLSIVQHIVGKLGGQVGVESQPGQGATFWFTLPGPSGRRA